MLKGYQPKKYTPSKYDKFTPIILIFAVIIFWLIVYYPAIRLDTSTNNVVCKEKYLGDGVVSFKFIRKSDNKELTYDMRESETNIVTFDRLNSKLKKGVSCQIVTDGFDNVQEVKVSIDD